MMEKVNGYRDLKVWQRGKEFFPHLSIARGSLAELHTLVLVAGRPQYLTREELDTIEQVIADVRMPLSGPINHLQESA